MLPRASSRARSSATTSSSGTSSRGPTTCPSTSCGRCLSNSTFARYAWGNARANTRGPTRRDVGRGGSRARTGGGLDPPASGVGSSRRHPWSGRGVGTTWGRGRHLSSLRGAAHRALLGLELDLRVELRHRRLLRGAAAELADDDGEDEDEDGRADAEADDERRGALVGAVAMVRCRVLRSKPVNVEGVRAGAALRRTCRETRR